MIANYKLNRICSEDPSLIENYNKAVNDQENIWWLYHRRQMYTKESMKTLIQNNLWYNRPADELIFLIPSKEELKKWDNQKRRNSEKLKRFNTPEAQLKAKITKRIRANEKLLTNLDQYDTRKKDSLSFGTGIADYFKN